MDWIICQLECGMSYLLQVGGNEFRSQFRMLTREMGSKGYH